MSGPKDGAQKAARRDEAQKQARIGSSVNAINEIYDNPTRQGEYKDFLGATREFYTDDLNRQKVGADRGLKFAMARNGQTGGQVSIDAGRTLGENYGRGVIEADRRAQGALADLQAADEGSRLNLISMAQSGLDATTGSSRALESMRTNIQANRATSQAQGIGDMFGTFADVYRRSQEAAEYRRAQSDYNTRFQAGFGYGPRG